MSFKINGHAMAIGSISTGTLRHEDLIKTFSEEVRRLCLTRPDILFEAECWLEGHQSYADNGFTEAFPNDTIEDVHEACAPSLLEDLENWLNSQAPDGIRFSAHTGDGSDFGWWEAYDETPDEETKMEPDHDAINELNDLKDRIDIWIQHNRQPGAYAAPDEDLDELAARMAKIAGDRMVREALKA